MSRWVIYYGDGKTYSWLDGSPENAPFWDVQVVIEEDSDKGWRTQSGTKYYCWDDRGDGFRWWGADEVGLMDYLQRPGWKRVLVGRTISNKRFQEIFNRARNEWGEKGSFYRWERRP